MPAMIPRWKCSNGHATDSTTAPAACPVCGDLSVEPASVAGAGVLATVDIPSRPGIVPATVNETELADFLRKQPQNGDFSVNVSANVEVPGYEILEELGRGGMGVVYKARQRGLNRIVALKMILAAEHAGPAERARFQFEVEAIAQLQHPNIVQIYDVGEVAGRPYFSLEFVDGGSLAQKIQGQQQTARASAAVVESIARAVAAAHGIGIVHRDLKPGNVLLSNTIADSGTIKSLSSLALRAQHPFGIPKITDFGLAKKLEGNSGQTQSGSVLGTPSYMAPEQAAGRVKEIGPHTDVYAIGAILYELLTGRPPFLAETPFETIMQVIRDEPAKPSSLHQKLPRDLEIICLKCLEKKPEKRYANAAELAEDLQRYLEGEPISARPATRLERGRKWVRRHPAGAGFIVIASAALAVLIAGGWVYHTKVQRERDKLAEEQKRSLRREIHLMVSNGTQNVNAGDHLRSLPWFTEALRLDSGDPAKEEMHRIRLAAVMRHCPRLTRAWFHDGRVNDASFSPDGGRVLTACADGTARVFAIAELDEGKPLLTLRHPDPVLAARYSPSGTHIVTLCADHAARIWDAASGKQVAEPLHHAGSITNLVFSPDGLRVLTTSADRTARIWDVLTGEASLVVFKHAATVTHADFSSDGNRVVTAGADGSARVWDAETGRPVSPILAHQGPVIAAYFSPDGTRVLTASQDQTARVWEVETGKGVTPFIRRSTPLTDAAYSPNGHDVVTSSTDGTGRVWNLDINDWRTWVIKHDSPVVDITFSPDGRALATGGSDNTARVWEITRGEPLTPPLRHNGSVYRVVFSNDGSTLLTASQDGLVRLWDIATNRRPGASEEMPAGTSAAARRTSYSIDRRKLLRIADDDSARVFDAGSGEPLSPPLKHGGAIHAANFSPDGTRVFTASGDRTARVWNAVSGEPVGAAMHHGSDVTCGAFSPDGKQIVTGSDDNTARVWNAETGEAVTPPLRHFATVEKVVFSPDGRCVLTASVDGLARVWDAATGEPLTPTQRPAGWIEQALGAVDQSTGWDLPPDQREVERLVLLAQWLSAHRIDAGSNLIPVDSVGLREVWDQLRTKYAGEFVMTSDLRPWHLREMNSAEKNRDWFGVVFHLTRLIEIAQKNGQKTSTIARLFSHRGRAHAEKGEWRPAAEDFAAAIRGGLDDESLLISHALARLATGDVEAYRSARTQLIDLCGESANGDSACRLAWVCLLAPGDHGGESALDSLSQRADGGKGSAAYRIVRGAKLARAGKCQQAISLLGEGQVFAEGTDLPRAWMFLALAEQRAGHAEEATRWMNQARTWLARNADFSPKLLGNRPPTLSWQQRLELQLLRDEVERALTAPTEPKKIERIE